MYCRDNVGELKLVGVFVLYFFLNESKFNLGGGGLCLIMFDYLCFCWMLFNGGELNGNYVFKVEIVCEMIKN